jgi:hypothetical protein
LEILKVPIPISLQMHQALDEEETTARMLLDSRCPDDSQNTGRINHLQEIIRLESIRREIESFYQNVNNQLQRCYDNSEQSRDIEDLSPVMRNSELEQGYSISSEWPMDPNASKSYSEISFRREKHKNDYSKISDNAGILHSSSSHSSEGTEFLDQSRFKPTPPTDKNQKSCWQKCFSCFSKKRPTTSNKV